MSQDYINEMIEKETNHLKIAALYERKIEAIQRSTGTLLPMFSYAHNYFRMKFRWYYYWHLRDDVIRIHYVITAVYIIILTIIVFYSYK